MTFQSQHQSDELAVRRVILRGFAALDRRDWEGYGEAFAEDGELEVLGKRRRGRTEIVAGLAEEFAKYETLQHLIMNEVIDVDGDRATGQWYGVAVHVPDASRTAEHTDVGIRYEFRAGKGPDGWRLTEVRLAVLWTVGFAREA